MNFSQALKYPFSDPQWIQKLAIAAGLSIGALLQTASNLVRSESEGLAMILQVIGLVLLLIASPFTAGYMFRASRNAAHGELLPEWDDWGGLFMDGIRVIGLYLGYFLPVFVLYAVGMFIFFMVVIGGVSAAGGHGGIGESLFALGIIGYLASFGLLLVMCLAVGFFCIPAYCLLLREGSSLGECFQIGKIWQIITNNFGSIMMFEVYAFLLSLISGLLTICTCGLGQIVAQAFTMMASAALFAQLAQILMPGALDFDEGYGEIPDYTYQ